MPRVQQVFSQISAVVALVGLTACGDSGSGIQIPGANPGAVAGVIVSPSSASITVGLTVQMIATLVDGQGNEVSGDVSWTSSDLTVASIDSGGLVTGLVAGAATITATINTISGDATVTVVNPPTP